MPPLAHAVEAEREGDHQHAEDEGVRTEQPDDCQGPSAGGSEQDDAE